MTRFVTYPKPGADGAIRRFEPAYWTVDFPLGMFATIVTGPDSLTVRAVFRQSHDLMGLIWRTVDGFDHGLFAYPRRPDYRGCVLEFDWQSSGTLPLDIEHGPTLTIRGRNPDGSAHQRQRVQRTYPSGL